MRILYIVFLLLGLVSMAQQKTKVKLIHADRGTGATIKGDAVNKLYGNVHLRKDDVDFYCDSAIRYVKSSDFIGFGRVKMFQGDSVKLYCDKVDHDGLQKVSMCFGDVTLYDGSMKLKTRHLDFNNKAHTAYYYNGGVVVDGDVTLVSDEGVYNTKTELFDFYTDVVVTNPQNRITSDTLKYAKTREILYFKGPTWICSEQNDLYAESGEYHMLTEDAYFSENAVAETQDYILSGDTLWYNSKLDNGYVQGKVVVQSKADSLFIYGNEGIREGALGIVKVFGENTLMKKLENGDTTYILADTLTTVEDTLLKLQKQILAYHKVRIYKSEMQALCDSLNYDFADSSIYFYTKPVMWNNLNQISGDSMRVTFENKQINKVFTVGHSFTIQNHHGNQFDQIKGRETVASFVDNRLDKVDVNGNGECLYFSNDDEQMVFNGINKIECSKMIVGFKEGELVDVTFLTLPIAHFHPPHELSRSVLFFEGFDWQIKKRPLLQEFINVQQLYYSPNELKK